MGFREMHGTTTNRDFLCLPAPVPSAGSSPGFCLGATSSPIPQPMCSKAGSAIHCRWSEGLKDKPIDIQQSLATVLSLGWESNQSECISGLFRLPREKRRAERLQPSSHTSGTRGAPQGPHVELRMKQTMLGENQALELSLGLPIIMHESLEATFAEAIWVLFYFVIEST